LHGRMSDERIEKRRREKAERRAANTKYLVRNSARDQERGDEDLWCELVAERLPWTVIGTMNCADLLGVDLTVHSTDGTWRFGAELGGKLVGAGVGESEEHAKALACAAASIELAAQGVV